METIIGMFFLFVIPCIIAVVAKVISEKYYKETIDYSTKVLKTKYLKIK
jgi:hypothetical protein